jgi:hypothetical protein
MAICTILFLVSNIAQGGIFALLGYYAARIRIYLPTFRGNPSVPIWKVLIDVSGQQINMVFSPKDVT